jgi:hypothetical protein
MARFLHKSSFPFEYRLHHADDFLTTEDLLDNLPYSFEEAAEKFGESMNNLSFSVVDAIQSILHDPHHDFHVPSLHALDSFHSANHPLKMLHDQEVSNSSCQIQHSFVKNDVLSTIPLMKQRAQTKLYTDQVQVFDYESWPTSSQSFHPLVEVSSGFIVRLRGLSETKEAFLRGETTTSRCASCQASLRCVRDAEFVLCQACRFISPVQQSNTDDFGVGGGLSLGLITSSSEPSPCSSTPLLKRSISPCPEGVDNQPILKKRKHTYCSW